MTISRRAPLPTTTTHIGPLSLFFTGIAIIVIIVVIGYIYIYHSVATLATLVCR
jgi:hypothetical protein